MTLALDCRGRLLPLDRPLIMGVVNVTPDSFSDGGRFLDPGAAIEHALELVEDGADLVDIGGESTRPGADPVEVRDELARVLPVVEGVAAASPTTVISIDTRKPAVMRAAVAAGASFLNDVEALQGRGSLEAAAELEVPVCLMHMQGNPRTMQEAPHYGDVVADVVRFLRARLDAARQVGIPAGRLLVDPGFGFGKTSAHNLVLLRNLDAIAGLGHPVLVGLSRKRTLGDITGRPVDERVAASVAAAILAVQHGASIVRVHDVAATRDALAVLAAVDGPLSP